MNKGDAKVIISIEHQIEKTQHHFKVKNSKCLLQSEVNVICNQMGVAALFVEGKYYKSD